MTGETDFEDSDAPRGNDFAAQLAMNHASEEAREYLRKQSRLADLQIDTLEKKDEFELSHLRFRRFSDYARFALELSVGFVVLLIVLGLATMVWNASQDRALVVDAISVPPDIAQTGMTGAALANRILDDVGAMDRNTRSFSSDFTDYHRDTTDDVRVDIPDTGISVGELNRYLRLWLGSETHVTGELVRTPAGLSLTVRYGANPGTTVSGTDMNVLTQKAAEKILRAASPLRYADYLSSHDRVAEGEAIAEAETRTGDDKYRARAFISLGSNAYWRGSEQGIADAGANASRLDPDNALGWYLVEADANNRDHNEENLTITQKLLNLVQTGKAVSSKKDVQAQLAPNLQSTIQTLQGDYESAVRTCDKNAARGLTTCASLSLASIYAAAYEISRAHLLLNGVPATRQDGKLDVDVIYNDVQISNFAGDYAHSVAVSEKAEALSKDPAQKFDRDVFLRPFEAEALARVGRFAEAKSVIDTIPTDCDTCARTRGRIAMLAQDWNGAAHWFAIVSARSPHIPYADTDWGMMLMRKGDLDGAIAKFASAHQKGPNFADPLEMWGEVLIAKNRSDLALAKFAEAAKHAPNWGRLHLKWGEALWWSGDKDGARKQFGIAATLDLTSGEKSELARVSHG